jgi:hypothetical protein
MDTTRFERAIIECRIKNGNITRHKRKAVKRLTADGHGDESEQYRLPSISRGIAYVTYLLHSKPHSLRMVCPECKDI